MPISERAAETAEPPPPLAGAGAVEPEIPSAPIVAGPTTPSTSSPLRAWNAFTAARVCGPNAPSAERPSFCWTAIVTLRLGLGPESLSPSCVVDAAAERAAGLRADDAVHEQAVARLEGDDRGLRRGPKTPSAEIPSWLWRPRPRGRWSPGVSRPVLLAVAVAVVLVDVVAVSCADAVCCASGAISADAAMAKPTLREAGRFARWVAARVRRSCERFSERSHVSTQAQIAPAVNRQREDRPSIIGQCSRPHLGSEFLPPSGLRGELTGSRS